MTQKTVLSRVSHNRHLKIIAIGWEWRVNWESEEPSEAKAPTGLLSPSSTPCGMDALRELEVAESAGSELESRAIVVVNADLSPAVAGHNALDDAAAKDDPELAELAELARAGRRGHRYQQRSWELAAHARDVKKRKRAESKLEAASLEAIDAKTKIVISQLCGASWYKDYVKQKRLVTDEQLGLCCYELARKPGSVACSRWLRDHAAAKVAHCLELVQASCMRDTFTARSDFLLAKVHAPGLDSIDARYHGLYLEFDETGSQENVKRANR